MAIQSKEIVDHLFRTEYGKLVAILTRIFGPSHIQLAEDIVQDTLISALTDWSTKGIPPNPTAWLVLVAKRKTLNELKRNKMMLNQRDTLLFEQDLETYTENVLLEGEIEDSQLRMIFTCCHSSINIESQIALTLKTLCGFGIKEVARALLTSESTINKRLYRAKESIRQSKHLYEIPHGKELKERLQAVSLTLYLLFNEGYNSSSGDQVIQKDLCLESIRLTKLLVDHFPKNYHLPALLSLMCFHTARFEARIDNHGAIVLFEDQDRNKWNKELIQIGVNYFKQSIRAEVISPYHIEARIAAEHCHADSFETTNWQIIYDQYVLLAKLKPNPIIQLNLAIIRSKLKGTKSSLEALKNLSKIKEMKGYYLLPATQGVLHLKEKNYKEALFYFENALELKPSIVESEYIQTKILECRKKLPPQKAEESD